MQQLETYLSKFWLSKPAFLLAGATFLAFITALTIGIREDEAWISEPVFWFVQEGKVRSMLWQGYYLHEQEVAVHHFLFVRITAALLHILPWHILSLRILPFVAGLLCAWLLVKFARKEYNLSSKQALLAGAVFLFFPINYEYLTYYRPEFFVALCGFGSFWCLYRFPAETKWAILAGLLAGLAMLMHLNGLIYVCAGGSYLLLKRQWKSMFLFGVASVLAFLPYLVVILQNLELFQYQLTSPANSAGKNIGWLGPFINLLNEQKRLFRGPHTIVVTVLALASIFLLVKSKKQDKNLLLYLGLFMLFMGLLASSKTSQYSILFYPFFALLITSALLVFTDEKAFTGKVRSYFYAIALLVFTWFSLFWMVFLPVSEQQNTTAINRQLYAAMPQKSAVAAPLVFVFDGIEKFNIFGLSSLFATDTNGYQVHELVRHFQERNIQYLVLNPTWKSHIYDLAAQKSLFHRHFKEIKQVENITLYKFSSSAE